MKHLFRARLWNLSCLSIVLAVIICAVVSYSSGKAGDAVSIAAWASTTSSSTINFGETLSASINSPAETDTYNFAANAGDTILIGAGRVSGDLWPRIRLYAPGNDLLDDESSPVYVEITQTLSAVGDYATLISDGFNGTYTGDYDLYLQRLNDPANAVSLSFGQTTSGEIAIPVEMDTYTFTADAGDTILIGMGLVSGDLWQRVRLYDPHGNLLNDGSSPVHVEITQTLPVAGAYTVLAGDGFNGTYTGSYNLYLQRLNDPAQAAPLSFGQTTSGEIAIPVEMDTYTFTANAGDTILIGMSRGSAKRLFLPLVLFNWSPTNVNAAISTRMRCVSGDLWQRIRLYDPDGNLLNDRSSPIHTEITQTLPVAGAYAILVGDGFNGTYTGEYSLHLQRLNNPGNVRSLSFGQTVSGTITMPAEMHAFAFAADAGDTVIIGMSRVFGDLWQRIRLYAPDGHLLSDESSPVHVEITHSLPVVGTYAILVNDGFNGTLMGHYTLNLQKLP